MVFNGIDGGYKEWNMCRYLFKLVILSLVLTGGPAYASDLEKEKRWADQVVDSLLDGEAHYLSDGKNKFLSLVTENSEGDSSLGAVIIHGTGAHPNWVDVVQPLRVGLTENGWHTISIQMPVLANDATHDDYTVVFPEVPARIDAAVSYLKKEMGVKQVVLVAHSLGSSMTAYHLNRNKPEVDGFVAVGMGAGGEHPDRNNIELLKAINIPMLDLSGSEDLESVLKSNKARSTSQSHNSAYTQIIEPGADHFFDGEEEALLNHVTDWLTKVQIQ